MNGLFHLGIGEKNWAAAAENSFCKVRYRTNFTHYINQTLLKGQEKAETSYKIRVTVRLGAMYCTSALGNRSMMEVKDFKYLGEMCKHENVNQRECSE